MLLVKIIYVGLLCGRSMFNLSRAVGASAIPGELMPQSTCISVVFRCCLHSCFFFLNDLNLIHFGPRMPFSLSCF